MDVIASARRLVVKAGSALMTGEDGALDPGFATALAADVARLRARGAQVVLVSSGAVALGRGRLGFAPRAPLTLDERQAAAAAGQTALMGAWEAALHAHGLVAAQILLTRDDTETRRRWLNGRATLEALLRLGAAPVVNENDTVATEELRYGDNDRLAARVAQMIGADALVLLSDIDGLYTADPRRDPSARHIPVVRMLTPEIEAMAGAANAQAGVGTGGMRSKLAAARIAQAAGCATVIADGRPAQGSPLGALETGARATVVEPAATPRAAYKAWIAGQLAPAGELVVDAGAVAALRRGGSLLPAGVIEVRGAFGKGDAVRVLDAFEREVARGLARRGAEAARRLQGLRSPAAAEIGFEGRPELIHRDDLVVHDLEEA